jgi:hypothetical protein
MHASADLVDISIENANFVSHRISEMLTFIWYAAIVIPASVVLGVKVARIKEYGLKNGKLRRGIWFRATAVTVLIVLLSKMKELLRNMIFEYMLDN